MKQLIRFRSIQLTFISLLTISSLFGQYHAWVTRAGSDDTTGTESALAILLDDNQQTYIGGQFTGNATFGSFHAVSHGGTDAFLAKLDVDGNFLWVKTGGGKGNDYINSLAFTPDGGIAALGVFADSAKFDTTLLSTFSRSYFLGRFDTAGTMLWIRNIGMEGESEHTGLCAGASGSLYASYGTHITKFSSTGNIAWDKRPGVIAFENSIGLGQSGDLYVTGQFGNSVTFGSTTLSAPGLFDYDIFVARLDTNGTAVWAKSAGSRTPLNKSDAGIDVWVDPSGAPIVTGTYFGNAGFGTDTLRATDTTASFVIKYSPNGNVIWLWNLDLPAPVFATAVTTNSDGYVAVAGYSGTDLTQSGGSDTRRCFVERIDPDGGTVLPFVNIRNSSVIPRDLAPISVVGVSIAGSFSGTSNFYSGTLTAAGSSDLYATYLPIIEGVQGGDKDRAPATMSLSPAFPNPFNPATSLIFTANEQNQFPLKVLWQIFDVAGRVVDQGGSTVLHSPGDVKISFVPNGLASGVYYCRVQAGAHTLTKPLSYIR